MEERERNEELPMSPSVIAMQYGLPLVGLTDLSGQQVEKSAAEVLMEDLDMVPGESGGEGLSQLPQGTEPRS